MFPYFLRRLALPSARHAGAAALMTSTLAACATTSAPLHNAQTMSVHAPAVTGASNVAAANVGTPSAAQPVGTQAKGVQAAGGHADSLWAGDSVVMLQERVARLERRLADMDARLGLLLAQKAAKGPLSDHAFADRNSRSEGNAARGSPRWSSAGVTTPLPEEASIGGNVAPEQALARSGGRAFDLMTRVPAGGEDFLADTLGADGGDTVDASSAATTPASAREEDSAGLVQDDGPPVVIRVHGTPDAAQPAPFGPDSASVDVAYREAHDLLKAGRAADAASRFDDILARGGTHELADNAMYWAGFARAQQGEHRDAIDVWQRLPLRFPRSAKVPDALFGMAVSHEALGEPALAETLYGQILSQHPRAERAPDSRAALARLRPR